MSEGIEMLLLVTILFVGYGCATLTFLFLRHAFHSEEMKGWIISEDPERSVDSATLHRSVKLNSAVSIVFMTGASLALHQLIVHGGAIALWRIPLEVAMAVIVYDFLYYFVHRYPFHQWKLLRSVHAVHHMTKHPRGVDSLLLHPAETCIGLAALLAAVLLVGGVHYASFAILFVGYTTINVINHAGIDFQRFPYRTLGRLAVKHDKHHNKELAGNYAFLTSIPDSLFGTVE
jgi:sterol desaturase/sphingolipid hydroxylase (fatty acid hydroxylase superfamily)